MRPESSPTDALWVSTGEIFPDPTQAEIFLRGRSSRGWQFWHVVRDGSRKTLKDLRILARTRVSRVDRFSNIDRTRCVPSSGVKRA
jgi:hypothetical protein